MTENDRDLHDRIDEYMYTSGSLLVMSKLPIIILKSIFVQQKVLIFSI